MKHLVDVYSEQLRISLKSEITDIYKRQIEEIQRLKLTPTIYVSVCLCVELNELSRWDYLFLTRFLYSETVTQNPAAERRFDCMKRQSDGTPVFT